MLRIYGVPVSVHTRKVIVAAIHKGLAYENVPVVPIIASNPPPNWPQLSPTGKIPVLQVGEATISDSTVICAYLDRTYAAQPLYPADVVDYIATLWLEEYADGTLFREVFQPLFQQKFVRPNILKQASDADAIHATCTQALPKVFGYLESVADQRTLADKELNVAQVAIASNLVNYQYLGFTLDRDAYPKLAACFERIVRHPAMRQALRTEQATAASLGFQGDFLQAVLA